MLLRKKYKKKDIFSFHKAQKNIKTEFYNHCDKIKYIESI